MEILKNISLSKHNTFKIGGTARYFALPQNVSQLKECISFAKENHLKYIVVGNGSNLLFSDKGYDGLVIKLTALKGIELLEGHKIKAYAGEIMSSVAVFAKDNGLAKMESIAGIPGSIGGGVYMNCGAYGSEIGDIVSKVYFLNQDNEIKVYDGKELEFSYRHSPFQDMNGVIICVELQLEKGNISDIELKIADFAAQRKDKQPLEYPSAGSTFKRPQGCFAAKLIDECKLKGVSVGGAQVSEKHSGFIINTGNATASDVLSLIDLVKKTVKEKTGVSLECEIKVVEE